MLLTLLHLRSRHQIRGMTSLSYMHVYLSVSAGTSYTRGTVAAIWLFLPQTLCSCHAVSDTRPHHLCILLHTEMRVRKNSLCYKLPMSEKENRTPESFTMKVSCFPLMTDIWDLGILDSIDLSWQCLIDTLLSIKVSVHIPYEIDSLNPTRLIT